MPGVGGYPAFGVPAPQLVSAGGPVVASAKLVAITFADDSLAAELTTFVSKIGSSAYWAAAGKEYMIGAATAGPALPESNITTQAYDDAYIQNYIKTKISDQTQQAQTSFAAYENTIFVLFYPSYSSIFPNGLDQAKLCDSTADTLVGAYHGSVELSDHTVVAYAVVVECQAIADQLKLSLLDATTMLASRALLGAATDKSPTTKPAFETDADHIFPWGKEIGDLCAPATAAQAAALPRPMDVGALVQTAWSNGAAKAGHNPCLPAADAPYFGAVPVYPGRVPVDLGPALDSIKELSAVVLQAGKSTTIEVDLFSDRKTSGPFGLAASDPKGLFKFTFDKASGVNGDKVQLTITTDPDALKAAHLTLPVVKEFEITSTLGDAQATWKGVIQITQ